MKKFFLVFTALLFSSTSLFAEYKLEPVHCTEKKKSNCGAYLYNTNTGATYFCDSEKCKEVMAQWRKKELPKKIPVLKNLKFLKKKRKRNQKYQNLRKQNNILVLWSFRDSYFYC